MSDASMEPTVMPLDLLREITNGFSEEQTIGSGSSGKVYWGDHGKKIAVKNFYDMIGLDDKQFRNEIKNLTRLRHKNIVRLVGYCHDTQKVQVEHGGKLALAEKTYKVLCLEYLSNGSLDNYLTDECDRYDWHTGYGIIKGICQGLKYLHHELDPPIYHLDLKPANVLLDENMVPRIADFGMARLCGDEQMRAGKNSYGTLGYLPPEFIRSNLVSNKFDIFSLGVIILKIMAGHAGYLDIAEMPSYEFINLVQTNWTNRLLEIFNLRHAYSEQVRICIEIGLSCVQEDPHKRPTIQDIVNMLEETETECTDAAKKDLMLNNTEAMWGIYKPDDLPNDSRVILDQLKIIASTMCLNDNKYSANPLASVDGFQIVGTPRPGFTLRASGSPKNGTTHCNFQWVRHLRDGTKQHIEGAMMDEYVVTADDIGTLLSVECTPVGDDGRKQLGGGKKVGGRKEKISRYSLDTVQPRDCFLSGIERQANPPRFGAGQVLETQGETTIPGPQHIHQNKNLLDFMVCLGNDPIKLVPNHVLYNDQKSRHEIPRRTAGTHGCYSTQGL